MTSGPGFPNRRNIVSAALAATSAIAGAAAVAATLASPANAATRAVRPHQEVSSCAAYDAAQQAKPAQITSVLRSAARDAAIAARTDHAWNRVAAAMRAEAGLPDAMLTKAQLTAAHRDDAVIRHFCAAAGMPAPATAPVIAATLNANTATAWTYFTNNTSLTAVQVAGLEGNLLYESGGALDPRVVQGNCQLPPGPCGVGIAQWTDPGSRFNGLVNLATTEGVQWNTLPVQLQFVWQELTSNPGYGLASLKACTTTACATRVVELDYERPAVQSTNCSATPVPSYCYRLADANQLLATYGQAATPTATQIIPNPTGNGYWLLSNQGGVYSYGGAPFYGSAAGKSYFSGQTAVGMAVDAAGTGYWILSASGGIYSYGSAPFYGAAAGQSYFSGQTAVGMAMDAAGTGYWIVSASGGIYSYGSAPFYGAAAGQSYFAGKTAASMAVTPDGGGYWIESADGGVYTYGDAGYAGGGV